MPNHQLRFPAVFCLLVLVAAGFALLRWTAVSPRLSANALRDASRQQLVASFARLPLQFEENRRQADSHVKFFSRGPGYALFLTSNEAVLSLRGNQKSEVRSQESEVRRIPRPSVSTAGRDRSLGTRNDIIPMENSAVLRMKLAGANQAAKPEGIDPLPGKTNYLLGNDPAAWRTGVETYSKVKYRNVYAGVDLVYYGNPQKLEYDFVVAPGASPREIALEITGAERIELDPAGDLVLSIEDQAGTAPVIRMHKPVVYQEANGVRREIAGSYTLRGDRSVGFEIAAYDAELPLVIDPVLSYSTFLGGSGWDEVYAIGVDASGNVFVTGSTTSPDFPLASPLYGTKSTSEDVFISKLSADGTQLIYSTFLGGNDSDVAKGLSVNSTGVVTVAGYTYSTNFPVASAFQAARSGSNTADGFVARLNESGSGLVFSTYLGGNGDDAINGLGMDSDGNAYVTGQTTSSDFPTTVGSFLRVKGSTLDAFVTKLSPAGNAPVYSTLLGGNGDDIALGIAVDGSGSAYVTGYTLSTTFPVVGAFQGSRAAGTCVDQGFLVPCYDAFITKFAASGSQLNFSTYLGGNGDDIATAIAVDSAGSAYITGRTISTDFPIANAFRATPGGLEDAFVTKLSVNGASLIYSTYLGGLVEDFGDAITVNSLGEATVAGGTGSNDFPILNSTQPLNGFNVFVLRMTAAGNGLQYSTFIGGTGGDEGYAIATDSSGSAYVGGGTASTDFPRVNPIQNTFTFTNCISGNLVVTCPEGFVAKLSVQPALFPAGVVNGASFAPNSAIAAGEIVSAFGADLTSLIATASNVPLPTILANLSVRINGILAPLYFVSGGQINLQVPWQIAGQSEATVQVNSGSAIIAPITVNVANAAPGIFVIHSSGQGAIQNAVTLDIAAPIGSISGVGTRPANRGDFVVIYCTGLGPVTNQPTTGAVSPGPPNLAKSITTPIVTIGGIQADVVFAGLSPGFVGLYQVNVQVPSNAPVGGAVPVAMSVGGAASNTVQMAIQ